MQMQQSFSEKIRNAIRIDRAVRFVWQASSGWTVFNALLILIQGIIPLLSLYLLKLIIDTITETVHSGAVEQGSTQLALLVAAAAAVALLQVAVAKLAEYSSQAQSALVTDYVYDVMHRKSVGLDLAYYENPAYFDTLHRAQREGPHRPTQIVTNLNQLGMSIVSLVAMVALLFTFHWSVGLLLFVSALPSVFVQIAFSRKMYRWQKERTSTERQASYYSWLLTTDAFAKELRLFSLGPFFVSAFSNLRTLIRGEKLNLAKQRGLADFAAQAFAALVLMGCFLLIGLRTIKGLITIGDMVMYFQAFQRGLNALKGVLQNIAGLYEDNLFVSYFFSFLDAQNIVSDPPQPKMLPATRQRGIEMQDLHFSYPGHDKKVLAGLSLTIAPNEVVALVGANGAGKSTLVKLLCRFYDPTHGVISLEGIDLRQLSSTDIRRQISIVFQDFVKYQQRVRENIGLGDLKKLNDLRAIEAAAHRAGADELIKTLPDGYDTMLGRWFQNGVELSHGEWQKIVIARAFLRDARFVILDEPTSSLDADTEYQLFTKFRELIAGRSALLISHRFSTVRMADRICVLVDGRISEQGTHHDLMAAGGRYADMYRKQASWVKGDMT